MKKVVLLIFILLPFTLFANDRDAVAMLEKVSAKMQADYPLQMTFAFAMYDADGTLQFLDDGSLRIDKNPSGGFAERYVLLLNNMKIWCDGTTLWSYMEQTDEIYRMSPDDDGAQNFSPVYLMQLYKQGYKCSMEHDGEGNVITLLSENSETGMDKVVVYMLDEMLLPEKIRIYMNGDGYTELVIQDYNPHRVFNDRIYRCPVEDYPNAEVVDMN